MQIFHAFRTIIRGLCCRVTDPFQDIAKRHRNLAGEKLGQECGLVETPFPFARGMEWHGNDEVKPRAAQARVAHGFTEPLRERVAQMAKAGVLEIVHELANQAAAAVSRYGRIEMENAMRAICATERLRDRAGKRL